MPVTKILDIGLPTGHEDVLTAVVVERFAGESAVESLEAEARDVEEPQPLVLGCPPERTGSTLVQGDVDSVVADAVVVRVRQRKTRGRVAVPAVDGGCDVMVEGERVPGEAAFRPKRYRDPLEAAAAIGPRGQMQQRPPGAVDQGCRLVDFKLPYVSFAQVELDSRLSRSRSGLSEHRRRRVDPDHTSARCLSNRDRNAPGTDRKLDQWPVSLTSEPDVERDVSSAAGRRLCVPVSPGVVPARHGTPIYVRRRAREPYSRGTMAERVLTLRELNRALLARQLLLERRKLGVQQAVERICAVQAQWPQSPYIGLWNRIAGFQKDQLTRALAQHRVVKTQLFRITLHITSARDYPYFFAVWGPSSRDRTPGVDQKKLEELTRRVRAVAIKRELTQAEVEELAAEEMGGMRWRTRTLTPLVHLPPGGTWSHYGRARLRAMEAVLGVELPSPEDGAERLVRSYLAAFGPATQEDLLRFGGLRVGDVRVGLERVELRTFRDERGRVLLDLPRAPLPDGDTPAPVRFLPKWDSSILAYAPPERTRILPEKYRGTVIRRNGDVLPTVLVDGFVAATWDAGARRDLSITPLRRLSKQERAGIDEEAERVIDFIRGA
jgi:Winged helix DNA-binding domain